MRPARVPRLRPVLAPRAALAVLALVALVAACGGGPGASPSAVGSPSAIASPSTGASPAATASQPASPSSSVPAVRTPLTVGLGYIPSVQFAQFYLAQESGAYAEAGLDVTLQNRIDPDLITLLGQGSIDVGSGDGTSVIPAVSQGIPIVYAATIYGAFPGVVVARADSGIATAADLKGRRIGIPGRYGSSWIMLQALLASAHLTPDDVHVVEFPDFGQATALQQGTVDAATGFANNEPVVLGNAGVPTTVLTVDRATPLPGPGLVVGRATLDAKHDALAAFTAATLHAMDEIAADPRAGLDATFALVPDLAQDPALQRQILDATIATWKNPRTGGAYGAIDREAWQQSLDFMSSLGLVPNPVTVDQLVDGSLLP